MTHGGDCTGIWITGSRWGRERYEINKKMGNEYEYMEQKGILKCCNEVKDHPL